MNRLSRKFILGIVLVLSFSGICSVLLQNRYLEKFYLFQKKNELRQIGSQLQTDLKQGTEKEQAAEKIEKKEKVLIVSIPDVEEKNNDQMNDEIREIFKDRGIGFQKYWLWEGDYEKIARGEQRMRLYEQQKLNYSLLVEYMRIDSTLYIVTMIIPNIADAFGIINRFLIAVTAGGIFLSGLFLALLVRQITRPLTNFQKFASRMEKNEYEPLHVQTRDELEEVAVSLNLMGKRLIEQQDSLRRKNEEMEQFLDNVAHELKTPISLIKLYAEGIRDGLDDGTFLDTIQIENQQMEEMVERLLYVSRLKKREEEREEVDLTFMIRELAEKYETLGKDSGIFFRVTSEPGISIPSSEEMLRSLFTNLITNAVKYSSGQQIEMVLKKKEGGIFFSITNETDHPELDLNQIFLPYYVGESSRNKKLSGTGLGLTIVKKIVEKLQYSIGCRIEGNRITFEVFFPDSETLPR